VGWVRGGWSCLLAGAITLAALVAPASANEKIYAELVERKLVTHVFDDFLAEVFRLYGFNNAKLGGTYDRDKINVLVVDTASFERVGQLSSVNLSHAQLYLNALALPPSVVVVDSDWLTLISLAVSARHDALFSREHPDPTVDPRHALKIRYIVADVRRGEAVDAFLRNSSARSTFRDKVQKELASLNETEVKAPARMMALPFVALFAHEFAHLDGRAPIGPSILHLFNRSNVVLEEERRADEVALQKVMPEIESIKAKFRSGDGTQIRDALFFSQALVSLALLQRDLVLFRVFKDFRGFKYHDVIYGLQHRDCPPEGGEHLDPLAFGNVSDGWLEPLPTLTENELAALRASIDPKNYQTHVHGFERAAVLLERLEMKGASEDYAQIRQFLALLKHLRNGAPLQYHTAAAAQTMDLTATVFLTDLEKNYRIEKAALCRYPKCYVLFPTEESRTEFIEVWATETDKILRIRYRGPIHTQDYMEHIRYLVSQLQLASAALLPRKAVENDVRPTLGKLRLDRINCGIGYTRKPFGDRDVVGRVALTDDRIELLIEGKLQ
jgi:hypothetical protein